MKKILTVVLVFIMLCSASCSFDKSSEASETESIISIESIESAAEVPGEQSEGSHLDNAITDILDSDSYYMESSINLFGTNISAVNARDGDSLYSETKIYPTGSSEPVVETYIKNTEGSYRLLHDLKTYMDTDDFDDGFGFRQAQEIKESGTEEKDGIQMVYVIAKNSDSYEVKYYFQDGDLKYLYYKFTESSEDFDMEIKVIEFQTEISDTNIFKIPYGYEHTSLKYPAAVPEVTSGYPAYIRYNEPGESFLFIYDGLVQEDIQGYIEKLEGSGFKHYAYRSESYFEACDEKGNFISVRAGADYNNETTMDIAYNEYTVPEITLPSGVPLCTKGVRYLRSTENGNVSYFNLFITSEQVNDFINSIYKAGFDQKEKTEPNYYYSEDKNGNSITVEIKNYETSGLRMDVTYNKK